MASYLGKRRGGINGGATKQQKKAASSWEWQQCMPTSNCIKEYAFKTGSIVLAITTTQVLEIWSENNEKH